MELLKISWNYSSAHILKILKFHILLLIDDFGKNNGYAASLRLKELHAVD